MDTMLLMPLPEPVAPSAPASKPARHRKPRVWTPFVALVVSLIASNLIGGVILIATVVGLLAADGVAVENGYTAEQFQAKFDELMSGSMTGALIALLSFQVTMAVVTLAAARLSRVPMKLRLGLRKPRVSGRGWTLLALSSLATVSLALFVAIGIHLLLPLDENASPLALDDPSLAATLTLSLLVSIVPAVVEELFFRGYMQRRLLQRWSPQVAIGVTSVLFALVHMDSLHHMIAVLPLGILLGIVAYRTRSVWPSVLLHMLHNAAACIVGEIFTSSVGGMSEEAAGILVLSVLGGMALVGMPALLYVLFGSVLRPVVAPVVASADKIEPEYAVMVQPLVRVPDNVTANDPLKTLSV